MPEPEVTPARASGCRRIQSGKLLLSKWTAVNPVSREKHFLVTRLIATEPPGSPVIFVELEAVHSRRSRRIAWRELADAGTWLQGWQ